jgi:hypothetical protein
MAKCSTDTMVLHNRRGKVTLSETSWEPYLAEELESCEGTRLHHQLPSEGSNFCCNDCIKTMVNGRELVHICVTIISFLPQIGKY